MFKFLLACSFSLLAANLFAEEMYRYNVNLNDVQDDKISVSLSTPSISAETIAFHFPATIPGTYATEDYGRLVSDFVAKDAKGNNLPVTKEKNNTFIISNATQLATISYKVEDSFDAGLKKNKIFEPAGTNIEAGKNYIFNNSGFFGFFEGMEKMPFELSFQKPADFYGATAMPQLASPTPTMQNMRAKDYHQLVDCPILFAVPDTIGFNVNNTRVLLAVHAQSGKKMAPDIYEKMKASMEAIARFLPELPVKNYAFLIYVVDFSKEGKMLTGKMSVTDAITIASKFIGKGFGALEHGNSSLYYMPDFAVEGMEIKDQMKDVAIHEFMHIITPLGLHSEHIGNFNYTNPVMSKHLWLYEGITEYFAGLIQVQAGLMSMDKYVNSLLVGKIKAGERFPATKMSMTEMSANVLAKKYHRQYNHVYDRGAVLGLLLDIEIIRLTEGKKTLKDVILTLRNRYGADKSFDEQNFIQELVAEVHPDLQKFFATYIQSRNVWDLKNGLKPIGIEYEATRKLSEPKDPGSKKDNDVKYGPILIIAGGKTVAKVGKKEWAGVLAGDKIPTDAYQKAFKDAEGNWAKEGQMVNFSIKREGKDMILPIKVTYVEHNLSPYLREIVKKDATQQKYFEVWIGEKN